jgi:hypothetical protein
MIPKENSSDSATKRKDWQMGLHETKKLVHKKRNGHQIKEASHRMGKNLFQLYIWQEINNQSIQELKKLTPPKKLNDPMQKWTNELYNDLRQVIWIYKVIKNINKIYIQYQKGKAGR